MRLSPFAVFTFFLLLCMLGAGFYGFFRGSLLGEQALAGITQLEDGLNRRSVRRRNESVSDQALGFVSEDVILGQLKAHMSQTDQASFTAPSASSGSDVSSGLDASLQVGFPIVTQDQGILMELRSVRTENEFVFLDVQLRNDSTQSIRFLYSFLDVKDDQGRALSTTVDGLPGELEPLSPTFEGTIRIPKVLLEQTQHLSITLTDYPDQNVKLTLPKIPVS